MADWVREEIRRLHQANVPDTSATPFVAAVHRLDRPVSGVLVLARTSKAARRLSDQFQLGTVRKGYMAMVSPPPSVDLHDCTLWLSKNRRTNKVSASELPSAGGQQAHTRLQVIRRMGDVTLVALFPSTGRPHQLRITMAHLGSPILGDLRYGATSGLGNFIALHAAWIHFEHPTYRQLLRFFDPFPEAWIGQWPWLDSVASVTSGC